MSGVKASDKPLLKRFKILTSSPDEGMLFSLLFGVILDFLIVLSAWDLRFLYSLRLRLLTFI